MSGIIRDFSQEAIMNIKEIIKENVDEEDQFALWDWVDDTFKMDDLDIKDYLDNVSKYQAHMVDKHNINSKKFDDILDRVYTVDVNYGKRFMEIAESLEAFNKKILDISNMISPEGITLDSETYEGVIKGIGKKYDSNISLKYKLEDIDKEMPELRDVPWYEKALNAVGGAGVAIVEDNLETGINLLGGTIDFLFGTKYRENGLRNLEATNQWIVDNLVTYEEGYYFGKTVGNAICVAEGIVLAVGGVTTLISAAPFTLIGGGLTLTGIGSVIGGPILAVSTTAVAAGTLATTGGFGMMHSSYNKGKENAAKINEVKKPEIDKGKLKKDAKKLDEKIGKVNERAAEAVEKVKYGEQYTKVNGKKALKSNVEYITEEGYKYITDTEGRISKLEANLELGKADRNLYAQRIVGRKDRLPNDDGGHLIASIFKGSGNLDNLVPMNSTLNRGEYKILESTWKKALNEVPPKKVEVKIKPIYEGTSLRPVRFKIDYKIDGIKYSDILTN